MAKSNYGYQKRQKELEKKRKKEEKRRRKQESNSPVSEPAPSEAAGEEPSE